MLTSLQNPLVKELRKLHRTKERRDRHLLLLEGTNLVEAAATLDLALDVACATPQWQAKHPQLWEQLTQKSRRCERVAPEVIAAIATTVNPDGVVATLSRDWSDRPIPLDSDLAIAVERWQDPGNLGTLIRTAVAADVRGLWLSADSVEADNLKVLRASAGAWFRLPLAVAGDLAAIASDFQSQGGQVVATLPDAELSYWDADFRPPTLLLLGNEAAGLSPQLSAIADLAVRIPIAESIESLNAAVASALLLFEVRRQRTRI